MRITKMANKTIKEGDDTAEKIMYCRVKATQDYKKGQLVDSVYNIVLDFDNDTANPAINFRNLDAFSVGAQFNPPKRRISEKYKQYWSDMCYNNQANKTRLYVKPDDDVETFFLIDSSAPTQHLRSNEIPIISFITSD